MSSTTKTPAMLRVDQLDISRFNCRLNTEDAEAVDVIARSLPERGLIHALQVHPMLGSKKYGVYAGGRRFRAHKRCIAEGTLPRDHLIAVEILEGASDAELLELSLLENLPRRDLRDYEQYAGVKRAVALGHTLEQVCAALGQDLLWGRRALRMANLAPPIFQALSEGRITTEQAIAFGATEDQECQMAAWREMAGATQSLHRSKTQAEIRRALSIGDAELDRLMLFVGEDAYRAAGGGWELDLFVDDQDARGRLTAIGALRELADAKLDEVRADLRSRVGRDVRFQPAPPPHPEYAGTEDYSLRIYVSDVEQTIKLPAGDVVGVLKVGQDGKPVVTWWWASRRAKHGATKRDRPTASPVAAKTAVALRDPHSPTARAAAEQVKDESGATRDMTQVLTCQRRAVLGAMVIDHQRGGGTVAQDLLVWSQCLILLHPGDHNLPGKLGIGRLGQYSPDPPEAAGHLRAMPAQRVLDQAMRDLSKRPCFAGVDPAAEFQLYRREPLTTKQLAAGLVVRLTLERSLNADFYRQPVHDALAAEMRAGDDESVREYWTPTAELLGAFPKDRQLEIAEPFVESATFGTWQRLKADEITALVLRVVLGASANIRRRLQAQAAKWVHPLLRFEPAAAAMPARQDGEVVPARETEAAE